MLVGMEPTSIDLAYTHLAYTHLAYTHDMNIYHSYTSYTSS